MGYKTYLGEGSLKQFSKDQEQAINDMAKKARQMLAVKPQWDMEKWFNQMKKTNPMLKGVSIREFGSAVLGIKKFSNR